MSSPVYDVFVDLSEAEFASLDLDRHIDLLARDAGLLNVAGHVAVALPPGAKAPAAAAEPRIDVDSSQSPLGQLARALTRAAAWRRHLVVVTGPLIPGNEILAALIEAFDRDPMLGSAQPRFAESADDGIWPLPGGPDRGAVHADTARGALPFLPEVTITAELLAACLVLRATAVIAIEALDDGYRTARGALLHLLCQTRRRGLRNVVVNRVVVSSDLPYRAVYPLPCGPDLERLRAIYPDHALAMAEVEQLAQRQLEPLLSIAHVIPWDRRRVLLDCRGMAPRHNGSSQCILGLLEGFAALDTGWSTDLLVWPEAAEFHQLGRCYPSFRQVALQPTGHYSAAVGLTQPWALSTIAELHRHALVVAFTMLDTIAWDVLYPEYADRVGAVWRFIARYADGLLYISRYTRERFVTRFPVAPGVAELVIHLSLLQEDHVDPVARKAPLNDHVLVFGNAYDHKDLRATVQLLAEAFPFQHIIAFGTDEQFSANVDAVPSGQISREKLHRLMAGARVIVYPSFYEGFGLPVVEGLAYGRPVVVRRSSLWSEIAGWSRLPGSLIEYDDIPSLVDAVGRVLAGLEVCGLPSGVHLTDGAAPVDWRQCAARVMSLLNQCVSGADGRRWLEREEVLRLAGL